MKTVIIFGGSGFLGVNLIPKLLKKNFRVKIVTRDKEKSAFLKTFAGPDFLSLVHWNYEKYSDLEKIIKGGDVVINLVGILAENHKGDFKKYHTDLAGKIAEECKKQKVKHLVHISALATEKALNSKYGVSKVAGEKLVLANFPDATILRPSIIFGPQDNFFRKFARTARTLRILPLINNGETKFQPIYVEDVTEIICKIICGKKTPARIYEIGGDKVYSFKRLMELVSSYVGKDVKFANLPFYQANLVAFFLEIVTKKILTRDQVELLKTDNVLSEDNFKKDFAINPKSVEEIVPNYIF